MDPGTGILEHQASTSRGLIPDPEVPVPDEIHSDDSECEDGLATYTATQVGTVMSAVS